MMGSVPDRIFYTKPSITERETRYAADAATYGWGDRCYEYVSRFEASFAEHLGVRHALATSSCTGALHMGLAALGIGPGDEVILADTNWVASVAPITYLGAKPVFVDILADSWCIDPVAAEAAISKNTKAIIAVHLYGNVARMDDLLEVGKHHGIPVIEDAAEAIGSRLNGRSAGSIGAFATFSFHGTKTITTGEGGAFVTNDSALFERVRTLSNHGRVLGEARQFWAERIGFKYKMSNLQAAVGLAQLERVDELVARKREIFLSYLDAFRDLPVTMNPEPHDTVNGYWMPTVVVDSAVAFDRSTLLDHFRQNNIDGRVFFWPLSSLPMFEPAQSLNSYSIYPRAFNLPSYHDMTQGDLDRVAICVKQQLRGLT